MTDLDQDQEKFDKLMEKLKTHFEPKRNKDVTIADLRRELGLK